MLDWKKKIDDHLEQQRLQEERKKAKSKAEAPERRRKYDAEQLKKHKEAFKCQICEKPSEGPAEEMVSSDREDPNAYSGVSRTWLNFEQPTGLAQCRICEKWTCFDHIHRGICIKCAKKL